MNAEVQFPVPRTSPVCADEHLELETCTANRSDNADFARCEIIRLRAMLDAVDFGAREIGTAANWTDRLPDFLERLGLATGVSRVTLFEIHPDQNGVLVESCRFDWAEPGLAKLSGNPCYTNMPICDEATGQLLDDWSVRRQQGEVVGAVLSETTGYTRQIYEEQGTLSFVSVPVHVDGLWWGFLGFDDNHYERQWSDLEIEVLRTAASLVAGGIARRRSAALLKASEERYALASLGANDGLWDWDLNLGKVFYSPRLCRILGRPRMRMGEAISSLFDALLPEQGLDLKAELERCIAQKRRRFEIECRVSPVTSTLSKEGLKWVVARGIIVWAKDVPIRVVGALRDISARKRIQLELSERTRELERNRLLLRTVIDSVPAIINVKDLESRYLLMNRFQANLYGVDTESAIGHTSSDFTGEAYGGRSRELDMEVIQSRESQPFYEREFIDAHGGKHIWYTAKMPLHGDAGEIEGVVTVALEISALKALERARADLARYVAPAVAEALATQSEPFGAPREQEVAVMFADIVQSSHLAQTLCPSEFFELLRECHRKFAQIVFAHGGALDKFTGDGVMATFGSPNRGSRDALNALACAEAMQDAFQEWNRHRMENGLPPIYIAIGMHYGPVLIGNIGDKLRMEFAVLGDTVIVAHRLERMARELDAAIVASDALISAAGHEILKTPDATAPRFDHWLLTEPRSLPGRGEPVSIWFIPNAEMRSPNLSLEVNLMDWNKHADALPTKNMHLDELLGDPIFGLMIQADHLSPDSVIEGLELARWHLLANEEKARLQATPPRADTT